MSFIHPMYIGHFDHEGSMVRFANSPADPLLKPIVSRPLDMNVIKRLVQELREREAGNSQLPVDWAIWLENGYLACDQCELNQEAIEFIFRLVSETGCELVDFNTRSSLPAADWLHTLSLPQKEKGSGVVFLH